MSDQETPVMTQSAEQVVDQEQVRTPRKRGPRKAKENTFQETTASPQAKLVEGEQQKEKQRRRRGGRSNKSKQEQAATATAEGEPRPEPRQRRERPALVLTADADGVAEVRVAASRPRELLAVPLRQAFASEAVKKVVLSALGAGIPNAIYAADELFRSGVCEKFAVDADSIVTEEDEATSKMTRRTPRVSIALTRSAAWDPQADARLPKTSTSN
jgi:hypothetical protein